MLRASAVSANFSQAAVDRYLLEHRGRASYAAAVPLRRDTDLRTLQAHTSRLLPRVFEAGSHAAVLPPADMRLRQLTLTLTLNLSLILTQSKPYPEAKSQSNPGPLP